MDVNTAIETRRSNKSYDPARSVDRETIKELIRLASLCPSSFNLQHWKPIVVDDPARKQALFTLALEQRQVLDAAATVLLVGDPTVYQQAESHFESWVRAGVLNAETKAKYVQWALEIYDPPTGQAARDETIRSCSLWAMTFMLAAKAKAKGLATCPMIGFDAAGVQREFHTPAPMFPVMLITLGYHKAEPRPRLPRRPLDEILRWNDYTG